jgi:hypothetical protein
VKLGFVQQMFVGNTLLHFYAAMRPWEILGGFFDEMVVMNTVSWNSVGGGGGEHISQLAPKRETFNLAGLCTTICWLVELRLIWFLAMLRYDAH